MGRSPQSRRWLAEHANDPYVQRARREGLRSRAAYKLMELDAREALFRPGQCVVDLGAAPGGWSQVVSARVAPGGRVVASDLLPMAELPGVQFIQGDFAREEVLAAIVDAVGAAPVDWVLSDMAPNTSGVRAVDQPRSMMLAELARDCALQMRAGGLLAKVFMGEGFDALLASLRREWSRVVVRKPPASRGRSPEVYLVARGRGQVRDV